jgi:putative membrane-bound dehydrogenase-like protein
MIVIRTGWAWMMALLVAWVCACLATSCFAQGDFAEQLPRVAPLEPAEALKSFKLLPGFRMELAAAEPDVVDPVAICFDERGRMFVAEMRGYSEDRDKKISTIRLLEDTDNDGRFEKSTNFAEGLLWPTAVFFVKGGLLVADAPDILFLRDTDDDGRADLRTRVLTGFGTDNVQGLLNSFQWSLDNRIVGATSSSGGEVYSVLGAASPVDEVLLDHAPTTVREAGAPKKLNLRGRDFAIDPRDNMSIEAVTGGGQHGATFDDWGNRFVCSNSDHLQQILFEERYLARNPYLAVPAARVSIAADGPQADVYRTSPVEAWRELRTKLRVSGQVKGPLERGGLASGYFTGATGVTVFRGNGWPEEYRGQVFIADVGSNLIHRKKLVDEGILYRGERIDEKNEFLTSTDNWFRPVQMANAPDGCLYICDMYREVIEHPASLPPDIKRHLDLTSRGRGRIWRVVHESFKRPEPVKLDKATPVQLGALLGHPNAWHRETAARLIYAEPTYAYDLASENKLSEIRSPIGRVHTMYALRPVSTLYVDGLQDEHPRVRQHAVRLYGLQSRDAPKDARRLLFEMVDDEDPRVRFQVALTLGDLLNSGDRNRALHRLIRLDLESEPMRWAILSSLHEGAGDIFSRLATDSAIADKPAGRLWLQALAAQVDHRFSRDTAVSGDFQLFASAVARLTRDAEKDPRAAIIARLAIDSVGHKTMKEMRSVTKGKIDALAAQEVTYSLLIAPNRDQPTEKRVAAVERLRRGNPDEVRLILGELLTPTEPSDLQAAAIDVLGALGGKAVATVIAERFAGLSPSLKGRATDVLCGQPDRTTVLLEAIENKQIAAADISPAHWKLLQEYRERAIREKAAALYESVRPADRKEVVEAYRDALSLTGNKQRGKELFTKQCATCHKVEGVGHELGPNLAAMKQRGAEAILVNVLDPNREVNPQFVGYALQTVDGRSVSGLIAGETATSVTLKRADNASETVLRIDIEELKSTGQSLMPEGLEKQLDKQAMADLVGYLLSL